MKVIRFHPGADAEVEAETRYYRRQAGVEVSRRFVEAVEQATRVALEFPNAGSEGIANTRRLQLRGFPHSLVYRPVGDEIVVFAVAHHAREPGYWRARS
ncbi:MAG TPA: type II toxin-antitoxin system RelE/ParE family toxin [Thermoanaerobaculia bacterium]|nr:type II toxin-antitoxin system RelE/ParE family toxin [Thermoanaerobaculia bacterium]